MIYRLNNNGFIAEFINLADAQEYASNNGNLPIVAIDETKEQQYYNDIEFGKFLIEKFLKDNRQLALSFTLQDNMSLLSQFAPIETLSRLGDIKSVLALTQSLTVGVIFTQERKDEFIELITKYLNL